MTVIQDFRVRLEQERGRFAQVEKDITQTQLSLTALQAKEIDIEQSAIILRLVAQQTQSQLQYYVSDMVTSAIEAIFPKDDYKFFLEFVQRRGKTEADLFLADSKGNRIKPSDAEGGGLVDIISLSLRATLWSLTKSSRNTIILDEPLKFLSRDLLSKAGELVEELSHRLNLQIIMVSHLDELIEEADKVFEIEKGTLKNVNSKSNLPNMQ